MLFKTSLDKTAIVITIFITALFAFIIGIQYITAVPGDAARTLIITVILLLIYWLAYAFHPTGYKITSNALIICRPMTNVRIERSDIKSIVIIGKKEISNSIRTFGVGGLFGYYGSFANATLGSMTWYATRRDTAVLITTAKNRKIVITPNEPVQFIAALQAKA